MAILPVEVTAKLESKQQKQVSMTCRTHGGMETRTKCAGLSVNLLDIQDGQSRGRHRA